MKERSLRDLFHLIKQVMPDEQEIIFVSPETTVGDALKIMQERGFNQLPVVDADGREVFGAFSYRSLARGLAKLSPRIKEPLSLHVEEFLETLEFAQIGDELVALLDEFDIRDGVLVGSRERLLGIVTTIDVLRYFYQVASPYVLLREIELAVRELIRASTDDEGLRECANMTLKKRYEELKKEAPTRVEDMTAEDYVTLLRFRGTWERFTDSFGRNQDIVVGKLARVPGLRNDVFHFRRELTIAEYEELRECRDWLLTRIRKVEAKRRGPSGG
jgi:CBS domain-containing protein